MLGLGRSTRNPETPTPGVGSLSASPPLHGGGAQLTQAKRLEILLRQHNQAKNQTFYGHAHEKVQSKRKSTLVSPDALTAIDGQTKVLYDENLCLELREGLYDAAEWLVPSADDEYDMLVEELRRSTQFGNKEAVTRASGEKGLESFIHAYVARPANAILDAAYARAQLNLTVESFQAVAIWPQSPEPTKTKGKQRQQQTSRLDSTVEAIGWKSVGVGEAGKPDFELGVRVRTGATRHENQIAFQETKTELTLAPEKADALVRAVRKGVAFHSTIPDDSSDKIHPLPADFPGGSTKVILTTLVRPNNKRANRPSELLALEQVVCELLGKRRLKNPLTKDIAMILTSFETHVVAELRGSTVYWSDPMSSEEFPLLQLYLAVAVRALKAHGLLQLGPRSDSDKHKRSFREWSKDTFLTPTKHAASRVRRSASGLFHHEEV